MTQNNEILDKLIDNNSSNTNNITGTSAGDNLDKSNVATNVVPTGTDDEVLITVSRVVWVRYKLYIVLVLFLIFIVGYTYVLPSMDKYESEQLDLANLELQILSFENKRNQYEVNKWLVDKIKQVDTQTTVCVNDLEWCNELPLVIKSNFGTVRSYVLLNEMDNYKMELDEKAILANIDGFLLRRNKFGAWVSNITNGVLNKIVIWDKQEFKENLKFVPIELGITFLDQDGLLSFIDNVEKKIPVDEDIRMLYKIDAIGYDIVNSDKEQDVSIFMYLYFYEK